MSEFMHSSAKAVVVRDGSLLLIEYWDELHGRHYNLPGGKMRPNESAYEALARKGLEEAGAQLAPGELLFVYEYIGKNHGYSCGDKHSVSLCFRCHLEPGSVPSMAKATAPDTIQVGVRWVPLDRIDEFVIFPAIGQRLRELIRTGSQRDPYWGDIT